MSLSPSEITPSGDISILMLPTRRACAANSSRKASISMPSFGSITPSMATIGFCARLAISLSDFDNAIPTAAPNTTPCQPGIFGRSSCSTKALTPCCTCATDTMTSTSCRQISAVATTATAVIAIVTAAAEQDEDQNDDPPAASAKTIVTTTHDSVTSHKIPVTDTGSDAAPCGAGAVIRPVSELYYVRAVKWVPPFSPSQE